MLVMRRLSHSYARQASHAMPPWLKRIALGVFLAALFIVQFVPGKESPGKENLGKESSGKESPGTESSARDSLNKGRNVPVETPYGNSPTPP